MSRTMLPLAVLLGLSFTLQADPPRSNPFRGDPVPAVPATIPQAEGDLDFKNGDYRKAALWYAGVAAANPNILRADQKNAWAFCRIKLATESLQSPNDSQGTAAIEKEVIEALALSPSNAEIQKLGQAVLVLIRQREPLTAPTNLGNAAGGTLALPGWEVLETSSFVVKYHGQRAFAEKIAEAAEAKRTAIFKRWSGPIGGPWVPRCEIVLHASGEAYAAATGKPAAGTGHATIRLAQAKVVERHIDLRIDDEGVLDNALPRELTHIVLAELFPYTPPPKWAEEGMAVLAGPPEEIDRFRRTCVKCARTGQFFTLAKLLEMKDYPAKEKITGFYCGSVSLVEYLVSLKGEQHFTTFLRDCQRYGSTSALKRQYDISSPKALQDAWLKSVVR